MPYNQGIKPAKSVWLDYFRYGSLSSQEPQLRNKQTIQAHYCTLPYSALRRQLPILSR
ncbi:hypothetical protein BDW68DRAFT_169724 [Aspergillus falconensis]